MSYRYSSVALVSGALLCWSAGHPSFAQRFSEIDAVSTALEQSTSIRVARIDRTGDTLVARALQAEWLPSASLDAEAALRPGGESLTLSSGVHVTQSVPGGGTASAGVTPSVTRDLGAGGNDGATGYSLSYTQPLATGAWRYASPAYEIRIQQIGDAESAVRFRRNVASLMSDVRGRYWTCYERQKALAIAHESLEQAERVLVKDRARFAVGDIAVIDTLGTALSWLEAQQAAFSAEIAFTQARRALALVLAQDPATVLVPESLGVTIEQLPEPEDLLRAARSYDPDRTLFELAYEKLQAQLGQKRNNLLPAVSLEGSYTYNDGTGGSASFADNSVFALIASYALPTRQRRIEVQRARLSMEQNRIEAEQRDRDLASAVAALVENWHIERKRLETAQVAAEVSLRKLDVAQKAYEIGSADQLTYLQARKDAFDYQTRSLQQQIDLKRLELTFDELTGNVFSRFGVQVQ